MDDLHFMERLERLGWRETELALRLYREPEMVKLLLDDAKAPDADRVAIALSADPSPPHVVVARDGAFVTALAAGMTTGDHPVVAHARIALAADRHEALKGRLAYIDWAVENRDSIVRLWRAILTAGARVPREVIVALAPLAPLHASLILEYSFDFYDRITKIAVEASERYQRRANRLSARELDALETLWRLHWAVVHLEGLGGYIDRSFYEALFDRAREANRSSVLGLTAMSFGDLPAMLRVGWAAARVGAPALRLIRDYLQAPRIHPAISTLGASVQLVFIGAAHARLRAEAHKALLSPVRVATNDEFTRNYRRALATLIAPGPGPTAEQARAYLVTLLRGPILFPDRDPTQAPPAPLRAEPMVLAFASNLPNNIYLEPPVARVLLQAVSWFARCDLADFYVPEADLDLMPRWKPKDSLRLLEGSSAFGHFARRAPKPQPPRPGRNNACPCGSDKKYKRCCGA